MTPETIDAVRELAGTVCRCGAEKPAKRSFCQACYQTLTPPKRRQLWRALDNGYLEAYNAAVETLRKAGRIA